VPVKTRYDRPAQEAEGHPRPRRIPDAGEVREVLPRGPEPGRGGPVRV